MYYRLSLTSDLIEGVFSKDSVKRNGEGVPDNFEREFIPMWIKEGLFCDTETEDEDSKEGQKEEHFTEHLSNHHDLWTKFQRDEEVIEQFQVEDNHLNMGENR